MKYQDIINKGLELGLSEIELYAQNSEGNTVKLFNGELSNYNSRITFGMSIRGLYNGKMGYVYTESLAEEDIDFLLKKLIANAQSLTSEEPEFIYDGKGKYTKVEELEADYKEHSLTEKVSLLQELEKEILAKDERIKQVGYCQYSENASKTTIMNSHGLNLVRSFSYMSTIVGATASDGAETTMGFAVDVNYRFDKIEKERLIKEASESATTQLGAGRVDSGKYEVVFKNDVATDILSAFASIFMGESALRKVTILTDKVGQKIMGDNITIDDDPFYEDAIIKVPFDDEGVPCYQKSVVKDGVFTGFLHSLKTANYFKTTPTGNGFKNGVAGTVSTSCTNLVLKPGTATKEEVIATVKKGIYVTEVNGLHAGLNPISGAFNVQASGFMIEDGKIASPVTLFVVSGNFYEMMNDVTMIGGDIEKRFVGVASPTLKIGSLMISGK